MNQVIQKGSSHYETEIKEIVHSKTNQTEGNSCTSSSTAQNGHNQSELFGQESPLCVNCNDSVNVEDLLENLSEDDTCVCIECYFSLHFPFLVPKYELLKMSNVQRNYRYSYNFKLVAEDFHEDDCIVGLIIENSDLVNIFQKQQQNSPSFLLNASLNKDGVSIEGRNNFRIRSNRIKYIENTIRFECLNLSRAASTSVSQNLLNPNQQANIRESQTKISMVLYHAKEIKISEYIHDTFNRKLHNTLKNEEEFQILQKQYHNLRNIILTQLSNESSPEEQGEEYIKEIRNQIRVSSHSRLINNAQRSYDLIEFPVTSPHHFNEVFDLLDYCEVNGHSNNQEWICPICHSHKLFLKEIQPDFSLYTLIHSNRLPQKLLIQMQSIRKKFSYFDFNIGEEDNIGVDVNKIQVPDRIQQEIVPCFFFQNDINEKKNYIFQQALSENVRKEEQQKLETKDEDLNSLQQFLAGSNSFQQKKISCVGFTELQQQQQQQSTENSKIVLENEEEEEHQRKSISEKYRKSSFKNIRTSFLRSPIETMSLINNDELIEENLRNINIISILESSFEDLSSLLWKIFNRNSMRQCPSIFCEWKERNFHGESFKFLRKTIEGNSSLKVLFKYYLLTIYLKFLEGKIHPNHFYQEIQQIAKQLQQNDAIQVKQEFSVTNRGQQTNDQEDFQVKVFEIFLGISLFTSIQEVDIRNNFIELCSKYILHNFSREIDCSQFISLCTKYFQKENIS